MLRFNALLQKFKEKGEKSGWTYISISESAANQLKSNTRKSFRVKGKIDSLAINQIALIPMGDGSFILPVNATMRRGIKKKSGENVIVTLQLDTRELTLSEDFIVCLKDEPKALETFNKLAPGHQRYFSKWIEDAKTMETKTKRIMQSVQGLSMGFGYPETIRYFKSKK